MREDLGQADANVISVGYWAAGDLGKAFDATGSYQALLMPLAAVTAGAAALMLFLPRYATARLRAHAA
jgi:hypothetical protein